MAAATAKTYSLKTVLSAVDKLSPTLDKVRKGVKVLDRSFADVSAQAKNLGQKLAIPFTAISGAGLLSVSNAVNQFMALGDSIDKASIRAGVTTGALQRLRAAAKLSGMSAEQMDKALTKLSYQMGKAAEGENKQLIALFDSLGVSWKDSSGKARDSASVMRELADAVAANTDPTARLQMLTAIFGDDLAASLIPALQGGAAGLDEMAKQADELGLVMSEKDVKASAALGDALSICKDVFTSLSLTIGAKLAPILMDLIAKIQSVIVANRDLIAQRIQKIVEGFADALKMIDFKFWINGIITVVEWGLKAIDMVGGFKTIAMAFGVVMGAQLAMQVATAAKAIWGLGVALTSAAATPVLIVAAVAAAIAAIVIYKDDIIKFIGQAVDGAKKLFDDFGAWFNKKCDDVSLFFSDSWVIAVNKVKSLWEDLKSSIFGIAENIKGKVTGILPEWMQKAFGMGSGSPVENQVQQNNDAPVIRRSERTGFGSVDGSVTIRVTSDNGAKATVENANAESGNLNVTNDYGYDAF